MLDIFSHLEIDYILMKYYWETKSLTVNLGKFIELFEGAAKK